MKTIAIVGTNGIPARYGGFETLAENLVIGLSERYRFIVYCSKTPKELRIQSYQNTRLIYLPFRANGWQSTIYDLLCTLHAFFFADVILLLGPSFGFILWINLIFRRNLIVNYGGLSEWRRVKFSPVQRLYAFVSYYFAARFSNTNVADNSFLKENIRQSFQAGAEIIRYGGDHAKPVPIASTEIIKKYPFSKNRYFLSLGRAQIDNNFHLLIEAFKCLPEYHLVIVSNWNISDYGRSTFAAGQGLANVTLLHAIYDSKELNYLRGGAWVYLHSQSECGTAPSLVEAICLGLPIVSFDVPTNRETTENLGIYFSNIQTLQDVIMNLDENSVLAMRAAFADLALREYSWKHINEQYMALFENE